MPAPLKTKGMTRTVVTAKLPQYTAGQTGHQLSVCKKSPRHPSGFQFIAGAAKPPFQRPQGRGLAPAGLPLLSANQPKINKTAESEKNDTMVESTIIAELRSASLSS